MALTPKQEAFCLAYYETGNASEAYRSTYNVRPTTKDESVRVSAAQLVKDPNIALRLQQLQERAASKVVLSRAWVLERLMRNADKGIEMDDLAASNKALELLGKVDELAMFVERSNVTSDNRHHHSAEPLSPFAQHLAEVLGRGTEGEAEKPVSH